MSDGFVDAYHVVDPSTGDSISISIFDREHCARAAEAKVSEARGRLGIATSPPDEVDIWLVVDRAFAV
jgi:hypothetical protein